MRYCSWAMGEKDDDRRSHGSGREGRGQGVLAQVKSRKIVVYKYKAKKNERKKQGHRQPYTKIEITAINA